jgi:hypothetical protein
MLMSPSFVSGDSFGRPEVALDDHERRLGRGGAAARRTLRRIAVASSSSQSCRTARRT